jgi:hypothetical protein
MTTGMDDPLLSGFCPDFCIAPEMAENKFATGLRPQASGVKDVALLLG